MRALVIQHHPQEGSGWLGRCLLAHGHEMAFVHAWDGQAVPRDLQGHDALVSLGGPMNVYQEDAHPWLRDEDALLKDALARGSAVLGICLGAQLIAKAAGAAVSKAPVEETGWRSVAVTPAGQADPLFAGLGPELTVLQWHGDTFDLPAGAALLATGDEVPHQAFGLGRAYGLQFHLEATPEMAHAWFGVSPRHDEIMQPYEQRGRELLAQAESVFANFVALAWG
ncbi:MAG: type 1 glutamine amidotransferase [Pseudomonadota bacterium]